MKIEEIRSRITNELLHLIIRSVVSDETQTRTNVIDSDQFLQLAVLKMKDQDTFIPHKHIYKRMDLDTIAQESWVVLRGKVKVTYYDIDDQVIQQSVIEHSEISITLKGGHNYLAMEDDTFVLEYKTGPYRGLEFDKSFIRV
jgi:cupin fold WbuC family metalloprotein